VAATEWGITIRSSRRRFAARLNSGVIRKSMTDWRSIQQGFEPDGALRDVYIAPASAALWNEFIEWVSCADYRSEFWHGQQKKALPREFREIKQLQQTDPTTLKLYLSAGVQINCHFFTDEEIECKRPVRPSVLA
jgi:hypothetical protein